MATTRKRDKFFESRVRVDGTKYEGAEFVRCVLVYSGGELPTFVNCRFEECKFTLDGAALRTAQYIQVLAEPGGGVRGRRPGVGAQRVPDPRRGR